MSASRALMNQAGPGAVRGQARVEGRREHTCGALGPVAMETPPHRQPFQHPSLEQTQ